jgi:hypothetical protein
MIPRGTNQHLCDELAAIRAEIKALEARESVLREYLIATEHDRVGEGRDGRGVQPPKARPGSSAHEVRPRFARRVHRREATPRREAGACCP